MRAPRLNYHSQLLQRWFTRGVTRRRCTSTLRITVVIWTLLEEKRSNVMRDCRSDPGRTDHERSSEFSVFEGVYVAGCYDDKARNIRRVQAYLAVSIVREIDLSHLIRYPAARY